MKPGDPASGTTLSAASQPSVDGIATPEEIHIAGVLVQCRPLDMMRISRAVDALAAAEVFQSSADGKLVVVIEAPASRAVLAVIDEIRALQGVVNVALVYQHAEPAAEMQQKLELTAGGSQPDESEEHA